MSKTTQKAIARDAGETMLRDDVRGRGLKVRTGIKAGKRKSTKSKR